MTLTRFRGVAAALLATATIVALCGAAVGFGANAGGDQIANPGAEVHVSVRDTRQTPLRGVEIQVVDRQGNVVNRQRTDPNGERFVQVPGRAGTYLIVASRPVVDGVEYTENRDSDQGAPVDPPEICPHLIRCVTVSVDERGTLHGPNEDAAQVDFLFTPPSDAPQQTDGPHTRWLYVRFWDVTGDPRQRLQGGTYRVDWLNGGRVTDRPRGGNDLSILGSGQVLITFTPPAGYETVGPRQLRVAADFSGELAFNARRTSGPTSGGSGVVIEQTDPQGAVVSGTRPEATTSTTPPTSVEPPAPEPGQEQEATPGPEHAEPKPIVDAPDEDR